MAEKKINGRTFKTTPMLATRALVLQAKILKLVGPAVNSFAGVMKGFSKEATEAQKAQSTEAGIKALAAIFAECDPEATVNLLAEILSNGTILRPSGVYDTIDLDGDFTDHQGDIFPVLFFVLGEQFGSFFTGLRAIGIQKIQPKA